MEVASEELPPRSIDHTPLPSEAVVWSDTVLVPTATPIVVPEVMVVFPSSLYRVPESVIACTLCARPRKRTHAITHIYMCECAVMLFCIPYFICSVVSLFSLFYPYVLFSI